MSTEKLYELAAEITNRRRFLGKLGAAALGSFGMLFGLSTNALAYYDYACCHLCFQPGPATCSGCAWCWTCLSGSNYWQCCECHEPAGNCNSSTCDGVVRSWATFQHCCAPGTAIPVGMTK
jgi:hypothetical protein